MNFLCKNANVEFLVNPLELGIKPQTDVSQTLHNRHFGVLSTTHKSERFTAVPVYQETAFPFQRLHGTFSV